MATSPKLPTRKRVLCTLAATAAAALIGGPASAIAAPNVQFEFDAPIAGTIADKDGEGTGFTSVQPNKNGTEYKPLLLDLGGGALAVNSTVGDIGNPDTQDNALQVTFDGTEGYTVSSTLKGPLPIVAQANSFQSAGIFVGSDFDNYVKLVAGVSPTGPRLHMAFENAGVLKQKNIDAPTNTAGWIQLVLTVSDDGKVTGKAIVDGTETVVWTTPEALPGALDGSAKAGIATTSANGQPSFKASYENFGVLAEGQALAPPPIGNVVAFKPKRTVIRGNKGAGGTVVPGFGEFGNRTLPTALAQNPLTKQLYVATQFGKIYVFTLDAANNATLGVDDQCDLRHSQHALQRQPPGRPGRPPGDRHRVRSAAPGRQRGAVRHPLRPGDLRGRAARGLERRPRLRHPQQAGGQRPGRRGVPHRSGEGPPALG